MLGDAESSQPPLLLSPILASVWLGMIFDHDHTLLIYAFGDLSTLVESLLKLTTPYI